jgi:hypothetical protein
MVDLPTEEPCRATLKTVERGLIKEFSGLWPSPRANEAWIQRN